MSTFLFVIAIISSYFLGVLNSSASVRARLEQYHEDFYSLIDFDNRTINDLRMQNDSLEEVIVNLNNTIEKLEKK